MRYVFVSDIHGCYDKLITSLENVKFNKETDTLVSVGDPFDRGMQSKEVLEFLMSCPNRILLWGNHDLRLKQILLNGEQIQPEDIQNGIDATLESFTGIYSIVDMELLINLFNTDPTHKPVFDMLLQYFGECNVAAEWNSLIATHAWLPCRIEKYGQYEFYGLFDKWRKTVTGEDKDQVKFIWECALWSESDKCMRDDAYPEKPLLIGHWHSYRLAELNNCFEQLSTDVPPVRIKYKYNNTNKSQKNIEIDYIDCSTFEIPGKLIAIDGCSNYDKGGVVNAYVYEAQDEPILYWVKF